MHNKNNVDNEKECCFHHKLKTQHDMKLELSMVWTMY